MVQASNNAADGKKTTKVNSISYWLSVAQLKQMLFSIAFGMHSLLRKNVFYGTYRLQRFADRQLVSQYKYIYKYIYIFKRYLKPM